MDDVAGAELLAAGAELDEESPDDPLDFSDDDFSEPDFSEPDFSEAGEPPDDPPLFDDADSRLSVR